MKCAALERADPIEDEARSAAIHICNVSPVIFEVYGGMLMPQREGSSVLFLRRAPGVSVTSGKGRAFIPTSYLLSLFSTPRVPESNKEHLELFYILFRPRPGTEYSVFT